MDLNTRPRQQWRGRYREELKRVHLEAWSRNSLPSRVREVAFSRPLLLYKIMASTSWHPISREAVEERPSHAQPHAA